MSVLELQHVTKTFRRGNHQVTVLREASLHVDDGEVVTIVGGREQGKTTLLRLAAGLQPPDSGCVLVDGNDLTAMKRGQRTRLLGEQISWVDRQGPSINLKILDYVSGPLLVGRRSERRRVTSRALEALSRVGASDCATQRWSELSNWERVLVSIAQGTAASPRTLLIDDIFDGLGMLRSQDGATLIRTLATECGCAVLMAVSDAETSLTSDRVLTLSRGKLRPMSDLSQPSNVIAFPNGPPGGEQSARDAN